MNPSGKLTVSYSQSVGHVPVFYDHQPSGRGFYHRPGTKEKPDRDYVFSSTDPLYPFGYGLSYTPFKFSDLRIEKTELTAGETLVLSVKVTNTGDREGKEVVQVYVNDLISSVSTPVKVLKAFKKISLKPGETRTVKLSIPCQELGLWNREMKYVVEPGAFEVMVGNSSKDIYLKKRIRIRKI